MVAVQGQDRWIGVGLDGQIQAASSNPVVVDDVALAVWRGEQGPVRVWEDRCPHRGMRLSFGFVRGETLRCIYHGWTYGTDGQCVAIPAHPDLTPPKTICANAYDAQTRYGIVWTNLSGAATADLPDLGEDAGWQPVRSLYIDRPIATVIQGLSDFDFGESCDVQMTGDTLAVLQFQGGTRLICALQPVNAGKTALHVAAHGADAPARRADIARQLEQLRHVIETTAMEAVA